jgi:methionyl-tRNA synthetase
VAADVLTRYRRLLGRESFFLTGTDEHGSKVEKAAESSGVSPKELVDRNSDLFKESWRALLVENDYFVRTTDERHEKAVQKLISRLHEATTPDGQPVIYPGDYRGLYCLGCEKFLTEKDLTSEGLCPDHLTKPELLSEKNYFFRLTSYLDRVRELIESDRLKILPRERKNEVLGLFKQGLEDFSISREKVRWGIPIPFDPSQKAYVWVDALPNYISAVGFGDDPSAFSKWWRNSHVTHLIGKDILKFHTIFWPAMLLAIGEKVPDLIFIHGYFTVSGQKMSKSLGNVISNHDLVERFGPDAARYLLLNMFPFGTDGDIRISDFYKKYNSDLANDFGNLVSRALKLLESNFAGKIPPASELRGDETALREFIGGAIAKCRAEIDAINPNGAAESFMSVCRELNRYFDSQKPWALAKEKELTRLGTVLRTTLEGIRTVSVLAHPYMPTKCAEIRKTLGLTPQPASISEAAEPFVLHEGFEAKLSTAVFPRLETPPDRDIAAHTAAAPACSDGLIDIAEFGKVQLRVAEILAAEPVPKADKLLKLQIAIGSDRRQIVAGIAQHYKPDQLVGRKIIVVANLKPAKLRGIESNGMLLAAKGGDKLALLTVDFDLPSGATIS